MGYHPINSHYKTLPTHPGKSNKENCLEAAKNCDCFFGIVRPFYGTGIIGDTSITHDEMKTAIALKKPRWFLVHRDVRVARVLLKQYCFDAQGKPNPDFSFAKTTLLDDVRVIDMYDDTIQSDIKSEERIGHWSDEYFVMNDIKKVIQTQFGDQRRILEIIKSMGAL